FGNDIAKTGAFSLAGVDAGANRVKLNLFDLGSGIHNGTFDLIDYSSLAGGNLSKFQLVPPVGSSASFALQDSGSAIQVVVTGAASVITWSGSINSTWDAGTPSTGTANWTGTGGQTKFFNGDFVNFNDSANTF